MWQQDACRLVLMSIIHFVCLLTHTSVLPDHPESGSAPPPGQLRPHSFLSHVVLSRVAFMPASGPLLGSKEQGFVSGPPSGLFLKLEPIFLQLRQRSDVIASPQG